MPRRKHMENAKEEEEGIVLLLSSRVVKADDDRFDAPNRISR